MKKKLDEALASAKEQFENAHNWMTGQDIDGALSIRVISSYVLIAMYHHESIMELTNVRQISASALVRPLFEALIRASWLSLREGTPAVEKAISKLVEGEDKFPSLKIMCEEIDATLDQEKEELKIFSGILSRNIKAMHSYTHGGAHMVSRCINEDTVAPSFTYGEMISVLRASTVNMLLTVLAFASRINNEVLAEKVNQEIVKIT